MDRNHWVFQLSPQEIARALRIISGKPRYAEARVTRRGRGKRPWVIIVDGTVQKDRLGRPRRFKMRKAALASLPQMGRSGRH